MEKPAPKRLKLDITAPKLERLAKVACKLPVENVSPAALQGCRVAVLTPDSGVANVTTFLASGPTIFRNQSCLKATRAEVKGLDGISLPSSFEEGVVLELKAARLQTEIQSITVTEFGDESLLAAVDLYGKAKLLRIDSLGNALAPAVQIQPSQEDMEAGWAGIAVSGSLSEPLIATACSFGRVLEIFKSGLPVRVMGTLQQPHALVSSRQNGECLVVAEGTQVTLWDTRAAEKSGCMSRLSPGGSNLPLFCVAADASGHYVAAGGAESAAFAFDVRRPGLPFARWPGCLKHDIISIHFPVENSDFIFVGGSDQEVRCGLIDANLRKSVAPRVPQPGTHGSRFSAGAISFRADDRLLGIHRAAGRDLLACYAASQTVLLAEVVI